MPCSPNWADVLRNALAPLVPQIERAFVFGSIAKQQDTAASDVNLMVVSDTLGCGDLFDALGNASHRLGSNINPALHNLKSTTVKSMFVRSNAPPPTPPRLRR